MFKTLTLVTLLFTFTNAFAAGDEFCHFNYTMITNGDVPVYNNVTDRAANSPGGGALFFYEISSFVNTDNGYELRTIAQLDCEDSGADKQEFIKMMFENCSSVTMGGVTVPVSEDFDFSKACG